jgi:hypothetical protein
MKLDFSVPIEFQCSVHAGQELKGKFYADGTPIVMTIEPCPLCYEMAKADGADAEFEDIFQKSKKGGEN